MRQVGAIQIICTRDGIQIHVGLICGGKSARTWGAYLGQHNFICPSERGAVISHFDIWDVLTERILILNKNASKQVNMHEFTQLIDLSL